MTIGWVYKYIPQPERPWFFALLGAVAFAIAGWQRCREAILFNVAFTLTGWPPCGYCPRAKWWFTSPTFVALALLAQQQVVRRNPERFEISIQRRA